MKINDFIPPIALKSVNYAKRMFTNSRNTDARKPPFDNLPATLDVKWVLDIGANIGDVTIAALESYQNSHVICIEPVQNTFEALRQRVSPFANRTHLHRVAFSSFTGPHEINITTFHGANSIAKQAKFHKECNPHVHEIAKEKINLFRLDDYQANFPCHKIDIMKIDVEGHELDVLKGGLKFISTSVDIIIVEISLMRDHSWESQAVFEMFSILNSAGFRLLNIFDLHKTSDNSPLLVQMDCVFRHISKCKPL
jgi:FkbM family methyltransferase